MEIRKKLDDFSTVETVLPCRRQLTSFRSPRTL